MTLVALGNKFICKSKVKSNLVIKRKKGTKIRGEKSLPEAYFRCSTFMRAIKLGVKP